MAPKAEPFVFTDFSGLDRLDRSFMRSRSSFFIQTSAKILPAKVHLPLSGITYNGQPIKYEADFEEGDGGMNVEVTVASVEDEPSSSFAIFFLNQMLDTASLRHACPFQVYSRQEHAPKNHHHEPSGDALAASAVITEDDLDQSARLSFLYFTCEKVLTRCISWYRRGLSTPDPLSQFLGLWNSIEIAASKFCEKNEKTSGEGCTKNQIHQAFKDYLGNTYKSLFSDDSDMDAWIKENYLMRKDIAHGLASSDLKIFQRNEQLMPRIRRIATIFLRQVADARREENEMIKKVLEQANIRKQERETSNE